MKKKLLTLFAAILILPAFAQPGTKSDISGNWYAYDAEGKRIEALDIYVFYNDDIEAYYEQHDAITFVFTHPNGTLDWNNKHVARDKSKITFLSEDSFEFFLKYMMSIKVKENKRWEYQSYILVEAYTISLRFIPEKDKLVGIANREKMYEALGNSDYSSVSEAAKEGKANILNDCEGNCGGKDVVYRRY